MTAAAAIGEGIAADITRVRDNGQRVLFVVSDPTHLIPCDREVADRTRRPGIRLEIVR